MSSNDRRIDRAAYPTDNAFFEDLLKVELAYAMHLRETTPYNKDFIPRVTLVSQQFKISRLPFTWSNRAERGQVLTKIAVVAKLTNVQGVMTTTDTMYSIQDALEKRFGIPKSLDFDAYQAEYHKVLDAHGGSLANLPRDCWKEALIVALKRPDVPDTGCSKAYEEAEKQTIKWTQGFETDEYKMKVCMIEDWWKIPDDHPNIKLAKRIAGDLLTVFERANRTN
jgi:hypothetical protein